MEPTNFPVVTLGKGGRAVDCDRRGWTPSAWFQSAVSRGNHLQCLKTPELSFRTATCVGTDSRAYIAIFSFVFADQERPSSSELERLRSTDQRRRNSSEMKHLLRSKRVCVCVRRSELERLPRSELAHARISEPACTPNSEVQLYLDLNWSVYFGLNVCVYVDLNWSVYLVLNLPTHVFLSRRVYLILKWNVYVDLK
jgi:hypothetical protein